jgi:hypothetical protein
MSASVLVGGVAAMAEDFRSDPMDSPEGRGVARRAWDAYVRTIPPSDTPIARAVARNWTMDLVGFYVAWHLYGGFDGLQEAFGMHPSTIWRKVAKFRKTFGAHPDEYRLEGVTIDTESFWKAALADQRCREAPESS